MSRNVLLILSLLFFIGGCSKKSSPTPPEEEPVEKNYLDLAWKNFEAQRYDSAIVNFTEAFNRATSVTLRAEAIGGRGWSNAYVRSLEKAKSDFSFALSISEISSDVRADCSIGHGFVLYALNDFAGTISSIQSVLPQRPNYAFAHDPKVTAKRVRLLLAQSYYANGEFAQAAEQMNTIDPTGAPHSADPVVLLGKILAAMNSL